ncbi:MAG: hypothetical protein EOO15_01440 [Chitinophagaceae bacterium]|nr:MAG: hypothetical protein EOO15_01440 [Chitinophagaceae bacterium]
MTITLFSRPVHSGKTTELQQWAAGRQGVAGILMPDVEGVRHFEAIGTGLRWPIDLVEPPATSGKILTAGPYRFTEQAFAKASPYLRFYPGISWLLIDEIGKLELRGDGFAPAFRHILQTAQPSSGQLLLVVRDTLVEPVMEHFELPGVRFVHSLNEL